MTTPQPRPVIDTCAACGKLFPRNVMALCSGCAIITENRYELVRTYLREHPNVTVPQVSRATGVSVSDINELIRSGRLLKRPAAADRCTCTDDGERCPACRRQLAAQLRDLGSGAASGEPLRNRGTGTYAESDADDSQRVTYVRHRLRSDEAAS